jgi:hypothetical protein
MQSVVVQQTSLPRAKKISSSLFKSLGSWASTHSLSVGLLTAGFGYLGKTLPTMLETDFLSIFPFAADLAIFMGLILTSLGIITKAVEVKNLFKKRKKDEK